MTKGGTCGSNGRKAPPTLVGGGGTLEKKKKDRGTVVIE